MTDDAVVELLGDQPVDLTNCDREPIHRLGRIQPVGILIGHDGTQVTHLADRTGRTGLRLGDPVDRVDRRLLGLTGDERIDCYEGEWDVSAHDVGATSIVELEPAHPDDPLGTLPARVAALSRRIDEAGSLAAARQQTSEAVRDLTGFDRVMIYEFHDDGHGEVVAEARDDDLEPFLGLHYPASDIPRQARALYVLNPTRLITDADAEPVPIDRAPDSPDLDLSHAQLRAVSPIHCQYLRNMGVGASMSISILDGTELAGLIACHHREPRHVALPVRRAVELLARILSDQFGRRSAAERERLEQVRLATQFLLLRDLVMERDPGVVDELLTKHLPALIECHGFRARLGSREVQTGELPPARAFDADIGTLLEADPDAAVRSTERLEHLHGGAIACRLSDGFLAWYRAPAVSEITWAGATDDATRGQKDLTPRASFESFVETLADRSQRWTEQDRVVAGLAQRALLARERGPMSNDTFDELVISLAAHAQNLELTNAELERASRDMEEFAYVVAHDLRAPLRSVRAFLQLFREDAAEQLESAPPVALESLGFIDQATRNMQSLLEGMLDYARIGHQTHRNELVDLTELVEEAAATVIGRESSIDLRVDHLPVIHGDVGLLTTMVGNLVDNAVKYADPDRRLQLRVRGLERSESIELRFEDNGQGISPDQQEQVFEMFRRATATGEGVGAGLAVVKRVAEAHGGTARVESEPGVGSSFVIELRRDRHDVLGEVAAQPSQ